MAGPAGKRRRLLWTTLLTCVAAVGAAIAAVLSSTAGREDAYTPGEGVAGITRRLGRGLPQGFSPVVFTEVSQAAGIRFRHFHGTRSAQLPEDMGSGLAWGDYDGDGDPDLYLVNQAGPLSDRESWAGSPARNALYRNDGDGTFTDVSDRAGVGARDLGMGAAWGDCDGDRDLDLLVTSYGSIALYENRGDGTFREVTETAGLKREGYWSGASWGDYDGDGDLDLYVCGYVRYRFDPADRERSTSQYASVLPASLNPSTYPPHPNVLFENDGGGRFTDVTERAGVANAAGRSLGAAWCDFDEDGRLDLYVANDISDNVLFRNAGDGVFADCSHAAFVADYRGSMGIAVADHDGDRDLDMFITHWIAQENALYVNLLSEQREPGGDAAPALRFMDDADPMGVGQIALDFIGWGTFFFDFDLDGRLDLFVANGSTFPQREDSTLLVPMRPSLFWNHGPRQGFFEVGAHCGGYFAQEWVGRGAAAADYDGDGDPDIAVVHHGDRMALLRNDLANGHHWLGVRLRGRASNSFGVGAKVTVVRGDRCQVQVMGGTPSYLSQPDLTLHFGLGECAAADRVEVRWPSGRQQTVGDVAGDRVIMLEEPQ